MPARLGKTLIDERQSWIRPIQAAPFSDANRSGDAHENQGVNEPVKP
jgi:hypothetical protein